MNFSEATGVSALGDARYASTINGEWSAPLGPNGGYLAAIVLRAFAAEVEDAEKAPRSLTLHYLRPPQPGPIETVVTREREGRTVATLTGRVLQDGKVCVLAIAAFGHDQPTALDYADDPMPDGPAAEDVAPTPDSPQMPPIVRQLHFRPTMGGRPFSGDPQALTGGWVSFREPYPADAFAVAQFTDAWLPAPFPKLTTPSAAPTIDLTIHFRQKLPLANLDPLAPLLIRVRSGTSAGGYCEEDTHIWAPDGTLLAQSRQLALLRPLG